MKRIILAIDDHELFRFGIEQIVYKHFPRFELVSVGELDSAFRAVRIRPTLILLDYGLVGTSGEKAMKAIKARWPKATVIVVTSQPDAVASTQTAAGAIPVISKAEPPQVLIEAIRTALTASNARPAGQPITLSKRQIEVLRLLREGHSNKAIARIMDLSEFTVRGHIRQLLKTIGAKNRTNAVFLAEQGELL